MENTTTTTTPKVLDDSITRMVTALFGTVLILLFLRLRLPASLGRQSRFWGPIALGLVLFVLFTAIFIDLGIECVRYAMPSGEILLNLIVHVMWFMVCCAVYTCYC